jgi:hypothetical protein
MKRLNVLIFVFIISVLSVFSASAIDQKSVLKGNISVSNKLSPELTSDNKVYLLLLPRYLTVDIKDGTACDVEGFIISNELYNMLGGKKFNSTNVNDVMVVTKITYNGKTVDVEKEKATMQSNNYNGRNMGHGMMGKQF